MLFFNENNKQEKEDFDFIFYYCCYNLMNGKL